MTTTKRMMAANTQQFTTSRTMSNIKVQARRVRPIALLPAVIVWIYQCSLSVVVFGLQSHATTTTTTGGRNNNDDDRSSSRLHHHHLFQDDPQIVKQTIYSGQVYQQLSFLSESQVQTLLDEIQQLELNGNFERKGLSNLAQTKQTFSKRYDRSICPVPWFVNALTNEDKRDIPKLIRQLQITLSELLNRPTLRDTTLDHECYYSKSEIGSTLARHMDDRHEEFKGSKGWLKPSRRSISWLIYLSDPADWTLDDHGGALRSYPQQQQQGSTDNSLVGMYDSTTHNGNLQIGWLQPQQKMRSDANGNPQPVYLDSWFPVLGTTPGGGGSSQHEETQVPEPHCRLYTVDRNSKGETIQLNYLTRPWLNDHLQGMTVGEFIQKSARVDSKATPFQSMILFTDRDIASHFTLLEDRSAWDAGNIPEGSKIVDTLPLRGSLVFFDSVTLPHQVEQIKNGTRVALAGWFHEETQPFPEDFYAEVVME